MAKTPNTPSNNPNYWAELDEAVNALNLPPGYVEPQAKFDPAAAMEDCLIDRNKPLEPQPIAVSYGQTWEGDPLCVLGIGDYSCITGISKSKKSFLKTALIASYIGGQANNYFPYFETHRKEELYILDFDTEQSLYHAKKAAERVSRMTGGNYRNHLSFGLREYEPKERLQIIEHALEKYGDKTGLVCIDGYADLIDNFNDLEQSTMITQKLLKWTSDYKLHITGILHLNPNGEKLMGHVGSIISRKAATVLKVTADSMDLTTSHVRHALARDEQFEEFSFSIINGLPQKQ